MDMLCLCAANKGRDHGLLKLAGQPITPRRLARLVQATEDEITPLLHELEDNAVFSRDRAGTIYSRRMVRAERSRQNGRLGGNPELLKTKVGTRAKSLKTNKTQEQDNLPVGIGNKDLFSSEDSSQTQGVSEVEISSLAKWNFDAFWAQYPHKVGKGDARKAFEAAKKRGASFVEVMAGLHRYAAKTDYRRWCNPSTFLNQDRWLDEPAAINGGEHRDETIDEQTARLVEQAERLEAAQRAQREGRAF